MKRLISTLAIAVAATAAALPAPAQAAFGLNFFEVSFTDKDGFEQRQAGSHPFAMTTSFRINFSEEGGKTFPDGRLRDAFVEQIAGFVGDTTAYPRCNAADFLIPPNEQCPSETAVGIQVSAVNTPTWGRPSAVYNLVPPPGAAARLGFQVVNQKITVDVVVNPDSSNVLAGSRLISQQANVLGSAIQLWGNPSDPDHDSLRGQCAGLASAAFASLAEEPEFVPSGSCSESVARRGPFLTLPTRCKGGNSTSYAGDRWENPGSFLTNGVPNLADPAWVTGSFESPSFTGCGKLDFDPTITAKPTAKAAQSPTGLDFTLDVADEGLKSTVDGATSESHVRKAVVTLPVGMTANPSIAEGLEVCSETDLADETAASAPGVGCPEASKIGTIEVESPLIDEVLEGALYQATPHTNLADDSLIAFYMVMKNPNLGILVKQAVRVDPDPRTGQLVATADEIPQLPFSHFRLRFRESGRSPLITPPNCGSHTAEAVLYPWSDGAPFTDSATFEIISGPNGGPCSSGAAPFRPGFEAGTTNNAAGRFSPFTMRLTRQDGEQDMTRFSATLPPGVVAKLAGTTQCSDAAIAAAKGKTGLQERAEPSCPASSEIGSVTSGAGVGSQLTYVPGKIYLAGPVGGAPLSVVAIVPAVAGPFDVGNVVVRQALRVDPRTAVVTADGSASDQLPHILAGIPLNVRDIRVRVDKPNFTLNPTSCDESETAATLLGGGTVLFPTAETAVGLVSRFQAAACASLGFEPRLSLRLRGGTKRGAHPALRGVFRPRPGDANLERLVVRFPRSAFLDQGHIRTICTRVQYAAGGGNGRGCPKAAIYGQAIAFSPLLDEPLKGPVYLRSSDNELPDFVAALHGIVEVETVARIDSKNGGIRATFTNLPDAPLTKVVVNMQGGKKGLIVNSTNLCRGKHRANTPMVGHNGKRNNLKPAVQASCRKRR
jgi:hypothetical protein